MLAGRLSRIGLSLSSSGAFNHTLRPFSVGCVQKQQHLSLDEFGEEELLTRDAGKQIFLF